MLVAFKLESIGEHHPQHIIFNSYYCLQHGFINFWVPIVTRKGGLDHRKFNRHYTNTIYAVTASGALMVIYAPFVFKHQWVQENIDTEQLTLILLIFWRFLLYLSLRTFVNVRHSILVLKN